MKAYARKKQSDIGFRAEGLPGINDKSDEQCGRRFNLPIIVPNANNHQPTCALVVLAVNPYNLDPIHHPQQR